MGSINNLLSGLIGQARKMQVEATAKQEAPFVGAELGFRGDEAVARKGALHLAGGERHRAHETGRPAGGEKLLGIGADTAGAGRRQLDVETAVGGARGAV